MIKASRGRKVAYVKWLLLTASCCAVLFLVSLMSQCSAHKVDKIDLSESNDEFGTSSSSSSSSSNSNSNSNKNNNKALYGARSLWPRTSYSVSTSVATSSGLGAGEPFQQSRGKILDFARGVASSFKMAPTRSLHNGSGRLPQNLQNGASSDSEFGAASQTRQARCIGSRRRVRSLKDVLRSAKDLLTNGFLSIEQRAGNIFWLGSNLLATLIPLASFVGMPAKNAGRLFEVAAVTANSTGKGASLAQFAASSGGIQSRVEYVMGWLERSIEHLPSFPRLHPQECVKRSICEAHNEPNKYGAIGLSLRLLFPASNVSSTDEQDDMEYKVINKYRHAAGYGLARRVDAVNGTGGGLGSHWAGSAACKEKYEDCLVSLLDVAQKLVDLFVS